MTADRPTVEHDLPDETEPLERDVPPSATVPALAAFALGGVYLLLLLLASRLPAPGGMAGTVVSVAVFMYLPLAIIYHGVRVPLRPLSEFLVGLIALGVWLGITGIESQGHASLTGPARNVALLVSCLFFGMLASRILQDRNVLVPACIVAALADLLSVGWGFTGHALQETPNLVTKLSVAVPALAPQVGTAVATGKYPIVAIMGVGDLFFVALFFAAAARFRLPLRRTFCFVFPLVALAMLLTLTGVLPWEGTPGLPFIAAGFLAANTKSFRFSPDEWRALKVAGAALLVLSVALFAVWYLNR